MINSTCTYTSGSSSTLKSLLLGLTLFLALGAQAGTVRYVNGSAGGLNNGTTWDNAYTDLQSALAVAVGGDEIWVAAGTYRPTSTADVTKSFTLVAGAFVYGGFNGKETLRIQRNWAQNPTILSGALSGGAHSYHVVRGATGGTIDGFTIRDGNANGPVLDAGGGGMIDLNTASIIMNCKFINNSASIAGGGLLCYNNVTAASVTNCLFTGNTSGNLGGGFYSDLINVSINNCTFSKNTAVTGGGVYRNGGGLTLSNCILWGDTGGEAGNAPAIGFSDVQGGFAGPLVINLDPQFVNAAAGDFHLQVTSPCIDAAIGPVAPLLDLDGNGRVDVPSIPNTGVGPIAYFDIGAYENQGSFAGKIIYVNSQNTSPTQDGQSWSTAFNNLPSALVVAGATSEIWVAAGIYKIGAIPTDTISMKNGVGIYGGFAGSETARAQRNSDPSLTVLNGRLAPAGTFHLVTAIAGVGPTAILDGFTLTGGLANGAGIYSTGAGIYIDSAAPTISNCILVSNSGTSSGALFSSNAAPQLTHCTFFSNTSSAGHGGGATFLLSAPTIQDCTFLGNNATGFGGGIFSSTSTITVKKSTFAMNTAVALGGGIASVADFSLNLAGCTFESNTALNGGGLYTLVNTSTSITNCVFQNNVASATGGGAGMSNSPGTVMNCTFSGNSSGTSDGGLSLTGVENVALTNCILWGNSSPANPDLDVMAPATAPTNFSCVKGTLLSGIGNINTDPRFTSFGDLRLQAGSPCIDAGTAVGAPVTDVLGTARPRGAGFDMGAYEYSTSPVLISQPSATPNPCIVGQSVVFSAAATDADGDAVIYNWDFGDGSSAVGATPTHAFAAAGYFVVKVVAINAGDPLTATSTNSGTVTVIVNPNSGFAGDSDGDGVLDEIEVALGSNAFDAASLPTGMSKMTELQNLSVSKLNVKLDFSKHGNDSIGLSGLILIPDGFKVSGQMFVVDIGGVVKSFTLDAKGSATSGGSSIKVPVKSGKAGTPLQISKYSAKFSKGTFADTLASAGLVNATTTAKLNVLVTVIFNGQVWQKSVPQSYVAKKDKGGVTK